MPIVKQPSGEPDDSSITEERACLRRAQEGHRPAQAEIISRYMPVVYRLCLKLLRNHESASDAAQEVFIRALKSLHRFDLEKSFRSWVCSIAWNFSRDLLRREKHRQALSLSAESDWNGTGLESERGSGFEPADREENSPPLRFEKKETAALVDEALRRLEVHHRLLIVLCDLEGLSYLEIAGILGCQLGTVKSRVHRARLQLKDILLSLQPDWFDSRN